MSAEFITLAIAHLLAVASPGPDFAVVLKHSLSFGKRSAVYTSLGIGSAILLHVAYAIAGIGLILQANPVIYKVLIGVAAGFLMYLGASALRSSPSSIQVDKSVKLTMSDRKSFSIGFLTNGLNPKATLFFLSLFTVIVGAETPLSTKVGYGIYLAIATFLWFYMISQLLAAKKFRQLFSDYGYWFERGMGVVLILISLHILLSEFILNS
jgi:threonine/homoserine/homoserine lactone efflux protein